MWAQQWDGIESLVRPFSDKSGVDVTDEMQRQVQNNSAFYKDVLYNIELYDKYDNNS